MQEREEERETRDDSTLGNFFPSLLSPSLFGLACESLPSGSSLGDATARASAGITRVINPEETVLSNLTKR